MILRQILLLTGVGVAIGLVLGIAGTLVFRSQLYGIGAIEWVVLLPVWEPPCWPYPPWWPGGRHIPRLRVDPVEAIRHA